MKTNLLKSASLLSDKIQLFHQNGYVIIRNNNIDKTYNMKLNIFKTYLINRLSSQCRSITYQVWRLWNQVSVSKNRYTLPLPLQAQVLEILQHSIGSCRPYLDSQLDTNAELVEVNAIITLPGALAQDVHSDIPYSNDNVLISGFIALSDVSIESGPTYLYEGTHTKQFHDSLHLSRDKQTTYYSSDGGMEEAMNMRMNDDQSISIVHHHGDEDAKEGSSLKTDVCSDSRGNYNSEINCSGSAIHHIHHQSQSIFNSLVPIHFHLQIGDILLFNSMIFHYGAKNSSVESRPLLSFSFQNVDSTSKRLVHIDGFTYHSHHTIRNAHLTVFDFPVIS